MVPLVIVLLAAWIAHACYRHHNIARAKQAYEAYKQQLHKLSQCDPSGMPGYFESYLTNLEKLIDQDIKQLEDFLATTPPPPKVKL